MLIEGKDAGNLPDNARTAVLRDTIDTAGQRVESLTGSFDPDLLDAVRAADGGQVAVPILLPLRPVGPVGVDGSASATCGGCQ